MPQQEMDEIRLKLGQIIRAGDRGQRCNLTKEEVTTLRSLCRDTTIVILIADKGNATVVMDQQAYDHKICSLLADDTYTKLSRDLTKRTEASFQQALKNLMDKGELHLNLYKQLRPGDCRPPYLYGMPKVHKEDVPLRPIVSTIGSPTYAIAKHLARLISPLAGQTKSYVKNSTDFANKIHNITIPNDTTMVSFDIKSLFTNVPVSEGL